MGTKLIDSNGIIEFVGKKLPPSAIQEITAWIDSDEMTTSIINQIEVLSYSAMTPEEEQDFNEFFGRIAILPLSEDIAIDTYQLRRKVKMKLPDAIIAATALYYGLTLVTRNTDDFKNLAGLSVVSPHDL